MIAELRTPLRLAKARCGVCGRLMDAADLDGLNARAPSIRCIDSRACKAARNRNNPRRPHV